MSAGEAPVPGPLRGPGQAVQRIIWRRHEALIDELWPDPVQGTRDGRNIPWRLGLYATDPNSGSQLSPEFEHFLNAETPDHDAIAALFAHDPVLASFYVAYLFVRRRLPPGAHHVPRAMMLELMRTYHQKRFRPLGRRAATVPTEGALVRTAQRDVRRAEVFLHAYAGERLQRNIHYAQLVAALARYMHQRTGDRG